MKNLLNENKDTMIFIFKSLFKDLDFKKNLFKTLVVIFITILFFLDFYFWFTPIFLGVKSINFLILELIILTILALSLTDYDNDKQERLNKYFKITFFLIFVTIFYLIYQVKNS